MHVHSLLVIPVGNLAVEYPLVPVARRTSDSGARRGRSSRCGDRAEKWRGDGVTCSPDTLRDPFLRIFRPVLRLA